MASTEEKAALVAKYRATTRFKDAWKRIDPDQARRAECEYDLTQAFWAVDQAAKIDKLKAVRTAASYRRPLQTLAETLRKAIRLAAKEIPPEYLLTRGKDYSGIGQDLKRCLEETEQIINWNRKRVRKGSRRFSLARIEAVQQAYLLLIKYRKRPRGVSHEGPWHKLARELFGNEDADLFEYMQRFFVLRRLIVGARR